MKIYKRDQQEEKEEEEMFDETVSLRGQSLTDWKMDQLHEMQNC